MPKIICRMNFQFFLSQNIFIWQYLSKHFLFFFETCQLSSIYQKYYSNCFLPFKFLGKQRRIWNIFRLPVEKKNVIFAEKRQKRFPCFAEIMWVSEVISSDFCNLSPEKLNIFLLDFFQRVLVTVKKGFFFQRVFGYALKSLSKWKNNLTFSKTKFPGKIRPFSEGYIIK